MTTPKDSAGGSRATHCSSAMLLQLPNKDASINASDAEYVIPSDWVGVHDIVSVCGWWIGKISIAEINNVRYVEWLQSYSPKFDEE